MARDAAGQPLPLIPEPRGHADQSAENSLGLLVASKRSVVQRAVRSLFPVDGRCGRFQFLAVANDAAIGRGVCVG